MRICVVGGGLAGSLLAWRLAGAQPGPRIDLVDQVPPAGDATAVSGGLVRGFETDLASCRDAAASLAELTGSELLRDWAGYREIGSSYACAGPPPDLDALLGAVARCLPGSAELATPAELGDAHWRGLPAGTVVVRERRAGYLSPDRLRRAALTEAVRRGITVLAGPVTELHPPAPEPAEPARSAASGRPADPPDPGGAVGCRVGAELRHYDAVVLATGRWTDRVLRTAGLPASGYRVKLIQVALWSCAGSRPGAFVDETSGLYGRPEGEAGMLLGVPSDRWDVDPDRPAASAALLRRTAQAARLRLGGLRLGRPDRVVAAADCYTEPAGLRLRRLPAGTPGVFTFTGGSGGAAKTALAASRAASEQLLDHEPVALDPVGSRPQARDGHIAMEGHQ